MIHKNHFYFLSIFFVTTPLHAAPLNKTSFETLTRPIIFNKAGLELFFIEQFNMPGYTEHILPSHFGHMAHFLHFSNTIAEPYDFVLTVFDIFHTRMKDCHWVNALSFSLLLDQLPRYIQQLCMQKEHEELTATIKDILYKRFISRFTKFSQNPMDGINTFDTFLSTMDEVINPTALEISELVTKATQKRPVADLQNIVSRFIESAVEKIVWNPHTQEDTWDSVCMLAEQITYLHTCGIIPSSKTVNHLYWSLIYRYCYFLRSTKDIINEKLFDYIKNDLAGGQQQWLDIPETEEMLTPKKEHLKYVIWECIAAIEISKSNIL